MSIPTTYQQSLRTSQVAAIFPVAAFTLVQATLRLSIWNQVWELELVFEAGQDVSLLTFNPKHVVLIDSRSMTSIAVSGHREEAQMDNIICIWLSSGVVRRLSSAVAEESILLSTVPEYLQQKNLVVGAKVDDMQVRVAYVGTLSLRAMWHILVEFLSLCSEH